MQCFKDAVYTEKELNSITFPIFLYMTIILPVSRVITKDEEGEKGGGGERKKKINFVFFSPGK